MIILADVDKVGLRIMYIYFKYVMIMQIYLFLCYNVFFLIIYFNLVTFDLVFVSHFLSLLYVK